MLSKSFTVKQKEQKRKEKKTRRQKRKEKEMKRALQIIKTDSHNGLVAPEPRPDKPIPNSDYSSISLFSDSESESESESESDSKSDSESDSESFKLLENLGKLRISEKPAEAEIAPPASAAGKVVENLLRPVKNVAEDLLQIKIDDTDAFIKRLEYVQDEIIPLNLPVCVPIHFFIMTGRVPKDALDTIINYPKFKCNGMNNLEIGKLLESYGYKHTNKEYKHKNSFDYSERYYEENEIPGFIDQIKSTLKLNHVTPVGFHKTNEPGHAACIANLNGEFVLVDANIKGMIPIMDLPKYMEMGGTEIKDNKSGRRGALAAPSSKFERIQIYYGASVEEPNIELPPKRDTSGKIVGIGPTMSKKEEPRTIEKRMRKEGGTRRQALQKNLLRKGSYRVKRSGTVGSPI
jgi:hypothetical protein